MKTRRILLPVSGALALVMVRAGWARADEAQALPEGLTKPTTATTGTTNVANDTYAAPPKSLDDSANDTTSAKVAGGAVLASGNSRSVAATGSGTFRLRRGQNQLSIAAAANYAKARPAGESAMQKTVENYQGKARYDRFVVEGFAVFGAVSPSRDRFQGLDFRLNLDPGIAYYFIDDKPTQLWTEVGYDYQYDVRNRARLEEINAGLDGTDSGFHRIQSRHSGRLFGGFASSLNDRLALTMGLEYLQALVDTENWRLVGDASIQSNLAGSLSVATTFNLRYDHNPLPGIEKLDTLESVSLVYTLM